MAKAFEYFEISYKINSENYLITHFLAKTSAKLNNLDQALLYGKKALSLNRFHNPSYILLSLIYSAKNDLKMANTILEELLNENPVNPILYIIKFIIFEKSKKYFIEHI